MEHKAVTDVATGNFRLRKNERHATSTTIVDTDTDELVALTTVEVSDGVVLLHCFEAGMVAQDAEDDSESEEEESDGEEKEDEDDDEEDDDADPAAKGRTYTVASGNSVTVRAAVIRLEPVGTQTAEGSYRVHVLQLAG